MLLDFLVRLRREFSITGQAIYESILAIAERVNRKVEVLRLHAQASVILNQVDTVHGDLGRQITALWTRKFLPGQEPTLTNELNQLLAETAARIHQLKETLLAVDSQVRVLKLETAHDDLLTLQRDLSRRSAALERIVVPQGCSAIGQQFADLRLPASVQLVTIFRGPFFINPSEGLTLRADDVLIMVGLQADLAQVAAQFTLTRHVRSA
jgi:K+/H+ antiporter YhaU regulatory subunit KhtT